MHTQRLEEERCDREERGEEEEGREEGRGEEERGEEERGDEEEREERERGEEKGMKRVLTNSKMWFGDRSSATSVRLTSSQKKKGKGSHTRLRGRREEKREAI